jgi:hypothetical protein
MLKIESDNVSLTSSIPNFVNTMADMGLCNEILAIKEKLIKFTNPTDTLLFVGNSAGYFYYTFNASDKRNVVLLPISGRPYKDAYSIPNPEQLDKFCNDINKDAFNVLRESSAIVYIDHSHSGESLCLVTEVLKHCGVKAPIRYIVIMDDLQRECAEKMRGRCRPIPIFMFSNEPGVFVKLFNEYYSRVVPYHPYWMWTTPHKLDESSYQMIEAMKQLGTTKS